MSYRNTIRLAGLCVGGALVLVASSRHALDQSRFSEQNVRAEAQSPQESNIARIDDLPASDKLKGADGSANASGGLAQRPDLLKSKAVRPPWQVAGVDYAVGAPSGTTLKNPATVSMSGVSVDKANKIVTVSGNNVTLDGYDFSLDGGWGVVVKGATATISDSKFIVGSNRNAPIQGTTAASNLTVSHTSVDGAGLDIGNTGLIRMKGAGLSVQYSWVQNSAGDSIQAHGGGNIDLRYNLIEQGGLAPGAHGDFLETIGGPFTATILNNTTHQQEGGSGGNQGLMLEPDFGPWPGVIISGEYGYNTFVSTGGNQNYALGVTAKDIVNSVTVHDNYFDMSGSYGFAPGGVRSGPNDSSPKTIYVNNINMKTGAILQDSDQPAKQTRQLK